MGFLFGKKKQQKAQLDSDDGLPWGWLYQNKELVDTIFHEAMTFESEISHAKGDLQKYAALKSYVLYLEDGKKHYKKVGRYVGQYFDYYIYNSTAAIGYREQFHELEVKLKSTK